jgi:hypothetical protein
MRRIFRKGTLLVLVFTCWMAEPASQAQSASLFAFTTNDFWLNLHHYLYALGRAHSRMPDATQPAVASAGDDERQGLLLLTEEERSIWDGAVTAYANGLRASISFPGPSIRIRRTSLRMRTGKARSRSPAA